MFQPTDMQHSIIDNVAKSRQLGHCERSEAISLPVAIKNDEIASSLHSPQ
jgi:hypothetical protein